MSKPTMSKRVVITGLGSVCAAGHGAGTLRDALSNGEPLFKDVERFNGFVPGTRKAGQVNGFKARDWMKPVLVRQTDLSTQQAMAAFKLCLEDADVPEDGFDPLRTGMMVGNAIGGMDFGEAQMYNQHFFGAESVSTYQAIAWFYAAALGQISIALGVKGYSKAFTADRVSSLHALGHAFRVVREGRADLCLAGGCEAPLVPFVMHAVDRSGRLSNDGYRPFDARGTGFLLGEGAVFLAFEEREHALERGATIYGEVKGYAMSTDPAVAPYELSSAEVFGQAIGRSIEEAGGGPIDLISADGAGIPADDEVELEALREACNGNWDDLRIVLPKAVVGELYGAGSAVQAAAGALALRHGEVYPVRRDGESSFEIPCETQQGTSRSVRQVLVASRANGGMNASMVLSAHDA